MLRMIGYEWKRIWGNRLTQLVTLGCVVFVAFCIYASVSQTAAYDEEGQRIYGMEAVRQLKQQPKEVLSQERIDEIVSEYLGYTEEEGTRSSDENLQYLSEKMYAGYYLQRSSLFQTLSGGYETNSDFVPDREVFLRHEGEDFYAARHERVGETLDVAVARGEITPEEKDYWMKRDLDVGEYTLGYAEGWKKVLDGSQWSILMMLAIAVGIAPVFAGEYQSRFDSLLLCMKHGKSKLVGAKLIAAFLHTSSVYWVMTAGYWAVFLGLLGTEGAGLPIQTYYLATPVCYDLTLFEGAVLLTALGYLANLCMMGIGLWLSSVMKNTYGAIVSSFLVMIVPMFLMPDMGGYVWKHVLAVLPSKITDFNFTVRTVFTVFGKSWDLPSVLTALDLAVMIVLCGVSGWRFRRHEVNK